MKFLRRFLPLFFLVVLLGTAVLVWINREYLRDSLILRSYDPPVSITTLASDTAMTDYAQRLFLVNKPELYDKPLFNENCKHLSDEAAVLGCFKGDRQGIYIYDVSDPRLYGIEQVTAAHEMLHQAFARLDTSTREHITQLLQDYYNNSLTDESVKSKMAIYAASEPKNLVNEMHSIFGTEIKDLPTELEQYYARYFTDRQKVVSFRAMSQAQFDSYRKRIADYDKKLSELKPHLEQMEAELTQEIVNIKATKATLEADLAAGRVNEYNTGIKPYNISVNAYNQKLTNLNLQINEFNKLVQERNEISVQVSELNQALDSSLTPQ